MNEWKIRWPEYNVSNINFNSYSMKIWYFDRWNNITSRNYNIKRCGPFTLECGAEPTKYSMLERITGLGKK